jgi:hypothetical protein
MFTPEELKERQKIAKSKSFAKYRAKNREKEIKRSKQYYDDNHASQLTRAKIYRRKNKEKINRGVKIYYMNHKEKIAVYNKEYRAAHREEASEKARKYRLKQRYGIGADIYDSLFKEQKGCCAICGLPQEGFKKNLAVDHNHETKKVRALLCHNCNLIIGNSKENTDILHKVILYLTKHKNDTI